MTRLQSDETFAKHLVIGGSGFLGRALLSRLGKRGLGTYGTRPFADGLHFDSEQHRFEDLRGRLPSGLTHVFLLHGLINPDGCARDPEGSSQVNVVGMKSLIEAIWAAGLTPVYLSTDYVFDGTRGLRTETEALCPTTEYGRQKALMETWLQASGNDFIIARSSKIISGEMGTHSVLGQWAMDFRDGRKVASADDQIFSPMHVDDTAKALIDLADGGFKGLYNVCGGEPISRYDLSRLLADMIEEIAPSVKTDLRACKLADIPFVETRPLNTSLSNTKLAEALQRDFPSLKELCAQVAKQHFGSSQPN